MDFLKFPSKDNLFVLFLIYAAILLLLLVMQLFSKRSLGFPLVYAFTLSILHAVSAYIHTLEDYYPRNAILVQTGLTMETTFYGFRMTLCALCSLVFGAILAEVFFGKKATRKPFVPCRELTTQLPGTLIVVALLSFFVFAPIFRLLPSLGTLTTAGCSCSVAGIYLFCWQAFHNRRPLLLLLGLASTVVIPLITVIFMGFASYGASAAVIIWLLVATFYRPRWLSVLTLLLIVYVGLSFYLSWMVSRDGVREAVYQKTEVTGRFDKLTPIFENFQWLDLSRHDHLEVIDSRLNQNDLAGKAWRQLDIGRVSFANGETLVLAAIAWVPRVLWPGKPVIAGGSDMVSRFTGQRFAEGTSVGAGQVLEFYVNFGWTGLFVGFFALGLALRWMDMRAADCLAVGDQWGCARWMLPAIGLIQPGGQMSEVIGSVAAYAVFTVIVHHLLFKKFYELATVQPLRVGNRPKQLSRRRYS